jgi:hypothetical protein
MRALPERRALILAIVAEVNMIASIQATEYPI